MASINIYAMGYRGVEIIKSLIKMKNITDIKAVISSTDRAIKKDWFKELQDICNSAKIKFIKRGEHIDPADYSIAVSWRWLIDAENLIVLHDSILPKYRGFSPLVSQLIKGETLIGVTALLANNLRYDSGHIIDTEKIEIEYPITIYEAIKKTTLCYILLVNKIVHSIKNKDSKYLIGSPQDESLATYSLWRDSKDYLIDWNDDANKIERFVNACGFPYLNAQTHYDSNLIFINKGIAVPDIKIEHRDTGKVVFFDKSHPVVVCGKGLYKILDYSDQEGQSLLKDQAFRKRFY